MKRQERQGESQTWTTCFETARRATEGQRRCESNGSGNGGGRRQRQRPAASVTSVAAFFGFCNECTRSDDVVQTFMNCASMCYGDVYENENEALRLVPIDHVLW